MLQLWQTKEGLALVNPYYDIVLILPNCDRSTTTPIKKLANNVLIKDSRLADLVCRQCIMGHFNRKMATSDPKSQQIKVDTNPKKQKPKKRDY